MRIYNKVVIDIDSGKVLEEDSFDYHGPMARCLGDDEPPQPSAEDRALQQERTDILRAQREEQEALRPFALEQLGLIEDEEGGLRRRTPEEITAAQTPEQRTAAENLRLQQERVGLALRGELPVSPALEESLTQGKQQLEEELARALGPNFRLTTSGIQRLGEFEKRADLIREETRRGEIGAGTALELSRRGFEVGERAGTGAEIRGFGAQNIGLAGAFGEALQPGQFQQGLQFQAQQQAAANRAGIISSAFGAAGTGAGLAIGLRT